MMGPCSYGELEWKRANLIFGVTQSLLFGGNSFSKAFLHFNEVYSVELDVNRFTQEMRRGNYGIN